jgi:N-acylglucosamine-6-phosphate 2-epimerase
MSEGLRVSKMPRADEHDLLGPGPDVLAALRGGVIASCQAGPESPLHPPEMIAALAMSAERGGAVGFRIDGVANVRAVRAVSALPIIGINKVDRDGFETRITTTVADALVVVEAGADLVALDGTDRPRPDGVTFAEIVAAVHTHGRPVMADVATADEGRAAVAAGADLVATTLAGYTHETAALREEGPAFPLLTELTRLSVPVVAEGRIWAPQDVARCFALGAFAVVIGSAITVPELITRRFVAVSPRGATQVLTR